jgi:hypothetical protein
MMNLLRHPTMRHWWGERLHRRLTRWAVLAAVLLTTSCAPLFDVSLVSAPFPEAGHSGSSAELHLHVTYGTYYAFYIELRCIYPECHRGTLLDTLAAKDGNARLHQRYYGQKIIPVPLHVVVAGTDSRPPKILSDSRFSDVGITMYGYEYVDVFVYTMYFPRGDYKISIEFLDDVPDIAKYPAVFTALLPRRG